MASFLKSIHGRALGLAARTLAPMANDALIGRLSYANAIPSSAVTNTTTETLFDTFATIKAGRLDVGGALNIRFQGIAPATNSTDTLTIRLRIGGVAGTVLIAMAATDVANNDVFLGEFDILIRTIGSSGTMVGHGTFKATPAQIGTATYKDAVLPSTTIDTTVNQVIGVTAQWSVANAGNSCRLDILRVEHW